MTVTCPSCARPVPAGSRFCPDCGEKLTPLAQPGREARKTVTILFADVSGSTALGERLDPEALRALMTRYFATMRAIIERHGGTVEKFIGDAVMAVFGIPQVHEDDALRAVRAANEIREALAALNERLEAERGMAIRFRTGVNTGEVVAGDPAAGTTLVTGDTVNTAARLEQAAAPGEILLGRVTYHLVRDAVDAEPAEPIVAKGKAEPVHAWRLRAVHPSALGRARPFDTPLVGRDREVATLTETWRRVVDERAPHLVAVFAPAGVGKSRLLREFLGSLDADARVLVGRTLSYGDGITFWPIREVIHQAAGITESDDQEAARARLDALLADERDATLLAARVATVAGLGTDAAPQEELFWALRRLLEDVASVQPTVVVLEDLHWAEDTLLDLIDYLIDLTAGVPLLFIATARPELGDRRPGFAAGRSTTTALRLEPLPPAASAELLASIRGGSAIPPQLRARILERADGTPLYVEEFVALLRDDGVIVERDDGWQASASVATIDIPPTIQALLAARLEALPATERAVAQRGSVIGRSFEVAALAELDPGITEELGRRLLALVRRELLRPDRAELTPGDAYRFRHALIREAAYDALPKAERAMLHERFADWVIRAAGDRITELEEIVAHHLAEAHRYRRELGEVGEAFDSLGVRARDRSIGAARRAQRNGDMHAAVEWYARAAATVGDADLGVAATADFITALIDIGELDLAERWLEVMRGVVTDGSDWDHAMFRLVEGRWASFAQVEERETDAEELEAIRTTLEAAGEHVGLARVWNNVAGIHWARMLSAESAEASERAADEYRLAGDRPNEDKQRAGALVQRAFGPTPWSVIGRSCEALLADPDTGLRLRAEASGTLAVARAAEGRFEEARSLYADRQRIFTELRIPLQVGIGVQVAFTIELFAGDPAAAEPALRQSLDLLRSIGSHNWADGVAVQLAWCLEAQDRDDEALELTAIATPGYSYGDAIIAFVRASVLAKRGDFGAAIREADRAVEVTDATDITELRADSRLVLAGVLRLAGEPVAAGAAAAMAAGLYDEKENLVRARVARALVAEVAGS